MNDNNKPKQQVSNLTSSRAQSAILQVLGDLAKKEQDPQLLHYVSKQRKALAKQE